MTVCGFPGGLGCPNSDGLTAGSGRPPSVQAGWLVSGQPGFTTELGTPAMTPFDQPWEVGAEQQGGFTAPRHPTDQDMAGIHSGLGAQHPARSGEVLQGNVVQALGQARRLEIRQGQAWVAVGRQQGSREAGGEAPVGATEDQHRGPPARGVLGQVQVAVDPTAGRPQLLLDHPDRGRALSSGGGVSSHPAADGGLQGDAVAGLGGRNTADAEPGGGAMTVNSPMGLTPV
jgi:hypothetical protein